MIAYREGTLSADALRRFRDGMANAHATTPGSNLMMLLKMTRFEPIPPDYEGLLVGVMKNYPPPATHAD